MKKILFILLLTIPFIGFGQEIVTNKDGKKIILNGDNTWEYLEITKLENDSSSSNLHLGDLSNKKISRFLNTKSVDIVKSFDRTNYEVLDYYGEPFSSGSYYGSCEYLIRDVNNKTGFIFESTHDPELNKKLNQKNSLEILEKGSPLNIIGTKIEEINPADGVDISVTWQYLDNTKDIKYLYFTMLPYNCVGDPISGRYDKGSKRGKITGPISSSNKRQESHWETFWYNNTVCSIKITKVEVEYMDGSKYTYVKELPKISSPHFKYFSF